MIDLSDLATGVFFCMMIMLCIFTTVHASLQIKNSYYMSMSDPKKGNNKKTIKLLLIIILSIVSIFFIYTQAVKVFKTTSETDFESYKKAMADLNETLTLEFNIYGEDTYTTAEDLAISLDNHLPVKNIYYLETETEEPLEFSKYEIMKFNLKDFENHPTLVNYDGTLMSIIKFQNSCKYINTRYLGKSDCIIEVDINNFQEPNQIGTDRALFAIDGENNKITVDKHFFK